MSPCGGCFFFWTSMFIPVTFHYRVTVNDNTARARPTSTISTDRVDARFCSHGCQRLSGGSAGCIISTGMQCAPGRHMPPGINFRGQISAERDLGDLDWDLKSTLLQCDERKTSVLIPNVQWRTLAPKCQSRNESKRRDEFAISRCGCVCVSLSLRLCSDLWINHKV